MNKFELEAHQLGYHHIIGIDEAGRGPIAGPLVVAGVIFPINYQNELINDSKKLTDKKRRMLFDIIVKDALSYTIMIKDEDFIDTYNIYQATKKAMTEIVEQSDIKPDYVLTDAMPLDSHIKHEAIIKGDQKSISIAAASILAKVTRDDIMMAYDIKYPEYQFASHKGYPTKKHIEMVHQFGVLDIHRKTYEPIKSIIKEKMDL